jgi:hypothetical protein
MILLELLNPAGKLPDDMGDAVHNSGNDDAVPKLSSVRKSRLTLAQINKLRMMNDVRKFEEKERIKKIKDQYGSPPEEGGMM